MVIASRDGDLLDGSGDGRGRGDVLVEVVLRRHVLRLDFDGGCLVDGR